MLAGGRSRRFGRDKLAEEVEGRPLLHHPVLRLHEVCGEVIVVLPPDGHEPPMPSGIRVMFARDTDPDRGPLAGVAAGLRASAAERAVVVGGDMPDLQVDLLREMLRASRETGAVAVVLSDGGVARPLPCVLRVQPADEAVALVLEGGATSLRDLLAAVSTVVVDEPTWTALDPQKRTLHDVDEPADLGP